jgi:hypothetical protein
VAVQVGAVKIILYVAAVEPLRKKERQGENHQIDGFLSFSPPLNANVLFCRVFFNLTMTKLRVPVLSFPDFTEISNVKRKNLKSPDLDNWFEHVAKI